MVLSVHATFGAAVASLVPTHPIVAFTLGFVSHFVLDAIPHRDYDLLSLQADPNKKLRLAQDLGRKFKLARDIFVVSLDAVVGLCLAFLFFFNPAYPLIFLLGAVGSMVPDFLTFLYLIIKHRALSSFFKFHVGVHSKKALALDQISGLILQFLTISTLIISGYILHSLI